ncbi:hypothetical protein Ocin01_00317 [Orchesella cincta]|uniref:O-acyltransferase WSD1 C-terminal domain-containing protein n=1 Tax=Orchesella cincta TaxID=48709 RepID=A0A1D2NMC6_ORCCI|nr:hypothetical protein Ocin01_00317 [Orchesella cincta]
MAFWKTPLFIIYGVLLWILFSPLWLPMLIVFGSWKIVALILAKCLHPELIPISFSDAYFALYSCDQQPLMSVGTTLRLKGRVDMGAFMKKFQECFLSEDSGNRYKNLYCYFVIYCGFVFKKPVRKLHLKNHFIEKTLPRGMEPEDYLGKWLVTDTYHHKPEGQPCWQVIILRRGPEYDREETFVSIKMHHGMIDGYSFVHMTDALTGGKSPYIYQLLSCMGNAYFLEQIKHVLQGPALAMNVLIRNVRTEVVVEQGNPFETKWCMSFSSLDLEIVKSIRRKTNAKFATIMMTAATGALKRLYMEDRQHAYDSLPDQVWIESPLGIPKHPAMTKGGKFCNHFTAGVFATPFRTEDRLYRLQSLEKDFHAYHERSGLQLMSWLLFGFYWVQPVFMRRHYTNYVSFIYRFTVLYSGLMTSPTKVSLMGHPVDNIYFLQATASAFPYVSLFLMCSTYDGKLDLSCYASQKLVKDREELERLIQVHLKAELEQMYKDYCQAKEGSLVVDMDACLPRYDTRL